MGKRQQQRGEEGAAPATEVQLVLVQEGTREVVEEWDEPITEDWKQCTMDHLEKRLQKYHEGRLTQREAEALTTRDRNVQRMVQIERLAMRASDLAWAWVAYKK